MGGPFIWGPTGPKNLNSPSAGAVQSDASGNITAGVLPVSSGGTGSNAVVTTPTANTIAAWDSSKNLSGNNFVPAFTTTATAAGTTTLTIASTMTQVFTGSTTQTVVLPTTSIVAGAQYRIINLSTGSVTVQSSGLNTISTLTANTQGVFTALVATPTTAANWTATVSALGTVPVTKGGTGTATAFTAGSVIFAGASGVYSQSNADFFWNDSSKTLGLGTAPTAKLDIIGSAGAQFRLSNTATNATQKLAYQTMRHYTNASADILILLGTSNASSTILAYGGGSGVLNCATQLEFKTATTNTTVSGTTKMTIDLNGTTSFTPDTSTATSGTVTSVSIARTYNQASGTAANTDLLINRTETAVGSGSQLLLDTQVGGSSKFAINNKGAILLAGSAGTSGQVLKSNGSGSAPSWGTGTAPTAPSKQVFTSGSGTYTTPANVQYIRVRMIGGGAGGSGNGSSIVAGSSGGNTTFGSSLLTANGGAGGAGTPGAGGTASVTTSATVLQIAALTGAQGGGSAYTATANSYINGGAGASTYFGGGGPSIYSAGGYAAPANTGAGGGSGGTAAGSLNTGVGGSAGGYVEAIIVSPSATYAYAVGAGGAGGAGTNVSGGAGGSGIIIVEEYYS